MRLKNKRSGATAARRVLILAVIGMSVAGTSCTPVVSTDKDDPCSRFACYQGATIRGDTLDKTLALVFTGDEFADGGQHVFSVLRQQKVSASFFFTGNFYRHPDFAPLIDALRSDGHYLGAHSDRHLLYCDWDKRDSLLVSRQEFTRDLENNYRAMRRFGIRKEDAPYFLPPYEWYNDSISQWTKSLGLQLINYTPGTLSHADYTTPAMPNYRSSALIYQSIMDYEAESPSGLNGFMLLSHIGTAPERTDKFYHHLEELIRELRSRGYQFSTVARLLSD